MVIHAQALAGAFGDVGVAGDEGLDFAGGAFGGVLDFVDEVGWGFGEHGHFQGGVGFGGALGVVVGGEVAGFGLLEPPVVVHPAGAGGVHAEFDGAVGALLGEADVSHFVGGGWAGVEGADLPDALGAVVFVGDGDKEAGAFAAGALGVEELPGPLGGPGGEAFIDGEEDDGAGEADHEVGGHQLADAEAAGAHGDELGVFAELPEGVQKREEEGDGEHVREIGGQEQGIIEGDLAQGGAGAHEVNEVVEQVGENGHEEKAGEDVRPGLE